MAGIDGKTVHGCKQWEKLQETAENDRKQQEMAGNSGKWREVDKNGVKWQEKVASSLGWNLFMLKSFTPPPHT